MKKRNPNATCGNCPYWRQNPKSTCGNCQAVSWTCIEKLDTEWCGQHPGFWEAEAEAEPDCDPPTFDDVLAAYRTAVEMARCYTGRICDRCANARTVACGRCLVGWQLLYKPKEAAEALKEFRRMHGLINQFVCTSCGNISSSTGPGFVCRECGGELTARVVIEQEEDAQ